MIRFLAVLSACLLLGACSSTKKEPPRAVGTVRSYLKEPPRQIAIGAASVLPLALSDDFQFRKVSQLFNDPRDLNAQRATQDPMISFERQRVNYGAISNYDRSERYGQTFYVWWRVKHPADLTVRFEYRQENLGSYVQAKEYHYDGVKGTNESVFTVIGDEYAEDGRVSSWRVLLIENGKIVGLHQSFLWN